MWHLLKEVSKDSAFYQQTLPKTLFFTIGLKLTLFTVMGLNTQVLLLILFPTKILNCISEVSTILLNNLDFLMNIMISTMVKQLF